MNTYRKYCPNVFLAKCDAKHEKGETISVSTKYGKENECIIFNLIYEADGYYYYSIVRADGFNRQEWAKKKVEKYNGFASNTEKKSDAYYKVSHDIISRIPMGQPILVGHHSERRHRKDLDKSWNAMGKCVELSKKSEEYENKAAYWDSMTNKIDLSMPESLDFFKIQLEEAIIYHKELKESSIKREHAYSLTYANKRVKELKDKYDTAVKLWA